MSKSILQYLLASIHHYNIMNNTIDEEEFQFQEKREEKYSPMDRIFYHQLARSRFYSTDSEYIYIHIVFLTIVF